MISAVLAWFTDPATWSGPSGIFARLGEHLWYSFLTLTLAALIGVPLGLYIGHTGRWRWLVSLANAARAVPSLGLLFAVAMLLGPRLSGDLAFVVPSILTLVVLAVPPLLSGAYAGVESVDPAARDAARGMGMTGTQVLFGVELPCSLPLLMSGVRSATLQVVATATIASFISLGGLGVFLVDGLASAEYRMMAGGAILVAALALVLDFVLAMATRLVVSPGLDAGRARGRRRGSNVAAETESARAAVTPGPAGVGVAAARESAAPSSSDRTTS